MCWILFFGPGGTGENKIHNPCPLNNSLLCGRDKGHADTDSNVLQRKRGEGETQRDDLV